MGSLKTQIKHVLRRLMHSPMFTVVTLLTIGIGVGANTAIFSVVNGILLKPLPYPDAERLVGVWQSAPGIGIADLNLAPSDYFTFRDENRTFQNFGVWGGDSVSVTGLAAPEQVQALSGDRRDAERARNTADPGTLVHSQRRHPGQSRDRDADVWLLAAKVRRRRHRSLGGRFAWTGRPRKSSASCRRAFDFWT